MLLGELRRQVDAGFAPALAAKDSWRHYFAIYLLAYFREPAAYPLFVQMGTLPGETLFDAIGDTVTEMRSASSVSWRGTGTAGALQALARSQAARTPGG